MIDHFRGEYDWASNFYYKAPFRDSNNLTFKTSEHYFACCKTLDSWWSQRILHAGTAAAAKKLGQQCPVRPEWGTMRVWVMQQALLFKFSQNTDILVKLLNTNDTQMVEGNYWHDNFWGDCRCNNKSGQHPKCLQPGLNKLGALLMNLRAYYLTVQSINAL
jgi:ribA/ribD-fused uncharacterized protein